ncbi:MAG: hypothetical protein U5K79_21455 [Cyclobacteriaceae bacterium]|nr:hypothetical protein [Cyclobacteriaceae bacterium]
MKKSTTLTICLLLSMLTFADIGTLESLELNSEKVSIQFGDQNESVILTFTNYPDTAVNCIIDIKMINSLEYKTRVMRYFAGLLVNNSFDFKTLVVVVNGNPQEYEWNRDNVSILVNKICDQSLII